MPRFYDVRPDRRDLSIYADQMEDFKKQMPKGRRKKPYVLLGYVGKERSNPSRIQFEARIYLLDVGTVHGGAQDLRRYEDRGFVYLDHWLPRLDELPPPLSRGDVDVEHGWVLEWKTAEGTRRRSELIQAIKRLQGEGVAISAAREETASLREETASLRDKLAAADIEIADLRKKESEQAAQRKALVKEPEKSHYLGKEGAKKKDGK